MGHEDLKFYEGDIFWRISNFLDKNSQNPSKRISPKGFLIISKDKSDFSCGKRNMDFENTKKTTIASLHGNPIITNSYQEFS